MGYINSGSSWSHCLFPCKSDTFFPQQFSCKNLYIMTFKGPYHPPQVFYGSANIQDKLNKVTKRLFHQASQIVL